MSLAAFAFSVAVIFAGGAVAILIDAHRHPTKPVDRIITDSEIGVNR